MKNKISNILIILLSVIIIGIIVYLVFFNGKSNQIESIELDKNSIKIYVGESEKINATVLPKNINYDNLLWESSNNEIASVTNEGLITGNSIGATIIKVHTNDNSIGSQCIVEVLKKKIEKIELDKEVIELKIGESSQIKATITPSEYQNEKLSWLSNNQDIALIDENGLITGISPGKTTISVIGDNVVASCIVNVLEPDITPSPAPTATATPMVTPTATPFVTPTATPIPSKLEIHFINAGGFYDDAIFIRSNNASIFIDGGRGANAVVKYLKELNVKSIDYVIGSHTEYDHIDAQGEVIRQFDVKHALYPNDITRCGCKCDSTDVGHVISALRSKNMTPEVQSVPSKLAIGDMELYFIAPWNLGCNKNNNSFVFILKFGNNKFMFTGDSDSPLSDVDTLINNAKSLGLNGVDADMVKYPHHGNQWINEKLIDAINPKCFVVPNVHTEDKPNNKFMNNMKAKGIPVYRQSDSKTGNILLTSDGTTINVTMDVSASTYAR